MRSFFSFDNLAIVVATCCAVAMLYVVPKNFDFLNPITQALGDFDMTDMVFTQFRDESKVTVDTNIVIVNIGDRGRGEIAEMLGRINQAEPAVVGIDAFFRAPKEEDPASDSALSAAMQATPNLVLVSKVAFKEEAEEGVVEQWVTSAVEADRVFDTLETSHPMFTAHAPTGYANLIIDQEAAFMTVREVSFEEECAGKKEHSFPIRIAQAVAPERAAAALARHETHEVVNFRGGLEKFYSFDADQVLDPETDLSLLKGKIVLMGFLGPKIGDQAYSDNFFTPLNQHYAGRSYPDMYGVVIHANVLSMILSGQFINTMPFWFSIVLALVVLILNVNLFTFIYKHYENWYDTLAIITQLGQSLLILYLTIVVFDTYQYKLALTPTLIGVALVGTIHDLYEDSLKKIILTGWARIRRRRASLQTENRTSAPSSEES
ncbi:MAG: CHASE2 domain-containing protein [Candidatus Kapabacteria bacterium]|nr:CHASE2 domain-containing protein [Ignavibacteria bacterium]MBP6510976.1 CHASE2 domain-containing protein [Candidatus Kapabacteria bacterium]MBK6761484.1 CHASE2 domain-containing protein [Ignavibacteria bacterium]MBK7033509.1 CHASE2 domain-containing protein [Ignavibacteria bacterium]MBK7411047.1 CHASE2 domain-containing protein [Ignavibacteria bacterium]